MNGVLAINKPQGMTSFDVVKKISRAMKVKAGHTGTLDPMATGVLLVCINKSTKLVPYLMSSIKTYEATMTFGIVTDSLDITGSIIQQQPIPKITKQQAHDACQSMIKTQLQQVPKVSAVRVGGKRLYQTKGEVELPVREITVYDCNLTDFTGDTCSYVATVSKGTYIRVLTQSIADKLSTLATTSTLCRTRNNHVSIEDCQSIEEAIEHPRWLDYETLLQDYSIIHVDDPTFILHGKTIELTIESDQVCFFYEKQPYAMYVRKENNVFKNERGLF